jgi:glycosyltransferase involved in cell wall biosynthesis
MIDPMESDASAPRRLLFHSYHFPPIGGSGAQRPLKMVRALVDLHYDSIVLTGGGATADRWAPEDESLLAEIPGQLEVRRLPTADEPHASTGRRVLLERWLNLSDPWSRWWIDGSCRLGVEAGAGADLIYVWMQPYTSAAAGAKLAQALRMPWVADLGDPWALDEMMIYPSAVHRRLTLRQMGRLLGTASAIVMSTPEAVERLLRAFPRLVDRPVVAIPNGYDADDFASPARPRSDGKLRIVHTGYLHTELGQQHRRRRALRRALGGSVSGLDILTRSHVYLVEAINRLLASRPELAGIIELHLAGVTTEADREIASKCPVAVLHGYVTHADSIGLMQTADLLFLPMQSLPPGRRATIVPGKTYEYLASGTPTLAAVPDGDARDILGEAGNAILVRPDDIDGMAAAIAGAVERFQAGLPSRPPDPDVVARFEYRRLAGELAAVFEAVLGSPSPARVPIVR